MVALQRGVNVGGRSKLAMADLRRAVEGCGHNDVTTYIQSGNVVFSCSGTNTASVARALEQAIADAHGLDVAVVVRTAKELAGIVKKNPYVKRGEDAAVLHVMFVHGTMPAALATFDAAPYAPAELAPLGREIYLFLPDGVGRSKLMADLGRRKDLVGTVRNWRTVTKLLEMAEQAA
jgi:uncharacterized protein (DUF1697 family)